MAGNLTEYKEKRNFEITPEPAGFQDYSDEGLRFVVQHHMARKEHYDFRLEWAGVLLSWAVPKGPSYNTQVRRLAVKVEDHPLEYRNFEGTIPKGEYGGGVVMLWDEGFWEPYGNVDEGLDEGVLKFELKGRRLKGKWALIRLKKKAGEKDDNWLLLKEKDELAKEHDGISEYTTSIRTGRTMEEIEKGEGEKFIRNPFDKADVQLAKLEKTIPEGDNWLYELKYDGYRIMAFVEANNVRLISRNGNDLSHRFQDVISSLISLARGRAFVLDGEMVVTDKNGKTDFGALQNYLRNPKDKNLVYIIFDLLALDGVDLRSTKLIQRKEMLEKLLKDAPKNLYYSRYVRGMGKECLLAACEADMEGIVGKKADSIYSGTRNGDWIKIKCDKRQEFIIGAYSRSDKRNNGISSLLLGVYEGDDLKYAGRAGTGITEVEMKRLEEKFKYLERAKPAFKEAPKARSDEKIIWLEPVLVAEIKFAEWTHENLLRQASYKGLRIDKDPKAVRRESFDEENKPEIKEEQEILKSNQHEIEKSQKEPDGLCADMEINQGIYSETDTDESKAYDESRQPEKEKIQDNAINQETDTGVIKAEDGDDRMQFYTNELIIHGVKISNPDKLIYDNPRINKEDVVRYYDAVAERMLPYIKERLLTAIRCPKGISQTCFYKKHPGPGSKELVIMPVDEGEGKIEEYFYIENIEGIIEEAQMGTIEFHVWGSRVSTLEMPDMMVFDLDPDEGMELERIRQGVRDVKEILNQLNLKSYLKTSGGKGYHVVVPFKPAASWDAFYDFARKVALVMEQKWPDRYTSNVRKNKRTGRIFIDWMRNGRGATSVAPYSLRARKGAKVSMPIAWDELDTVAPDGIGLKEAMVRVKLPDPWNGFFDTEQMLK